MSFAQDFFFLGSGDGIDLGDDLVGQFLHVTLKALVLILADVTLLLVSLERIHAIATNVAGCNPRFFGILRRQLGKFLAEIGRASCRERVCPYLLISVVAVPLKKKPTNKKL